MVYIVIGDIVISDKQGREVRRVRWDFKKPVEARSRVEIELMDTFRYLREVEERLKSLYSLATSIQAVLMTMHRAMDDRHINQSELDVHSGKDDS